MVYPVEKCFWLLSLHPLKLKSKENKGPEIVVEKLMYKCCINFI